MSTLSIVLIAVGAVVLLGGVAALWFLVPSFKAWVKTKAKSELYKLLKEKTEDIVRNLMEAEYAKVAQKVKNGELKTKEQVKQELYRLGQQAKLLIKESMSKEELKTLGGHADGELDKLIRAAADKVSPFPGKETAASLLENRVSDMLIDKGLDHVKGWFTTG